MQLDLCQNLVGEAERHHEAWVPRGVAQVKQSAFAQHQHRMTVGEDELVDLRLDVDAHDITHLVQPGHIDFVVEVTNVADDCLMFHAGHVFGRDDALVASGGDEDVGSFHDVFDTDDLESFHRSLQSTDRVDFGDHDPGALTLEGRSATLTNIAVTTNDGELAAKHDVGTAVDAVDQ